MRITVKTERNVAILAISVTVLAIAVLIQTYRITSLSKEVEAIKETQAKITKASYPVDESLINAVIIVESAGNPMAFNQSSKSVGLMQLSPLIYGKFCNLTTAQAFDPELNKQCGAKFLAHLITKRKSLNSALYHYNNGYVGKNTTYVGKVTKHLTNIQLASYSK